MQHDWTARSQTRRALSEALLEARSHSDSRAGQVLWHLVERYLDLTTARNANAEQLRNLADAAVSIRRRVGAGTWDLA